MAKKWADKGEKTTPANNDEFLIIDSADPVLATKDKRVKFSNLGIINAPVSSVDNSVPTWDGTTGSTLKDTGKVFIIGNNLTNVDGIISANANATIIVFSEANLPTPSGGKITLAGNTLYVICAPISSVNTLVFQTGSQLTAINAGVNIWTYTGTGAIVESTNIGSISIEDAFILSTNSAATAFNLQGTGQLTITETAIVSNNLGTIADWSLILAGDSTFLNFDTGLTLDNIALAAFRSIAVVSNAGVGSARSLIRLTGRKTKTIAFQFGQMVPIPPFTAFYISPTINKDARITLDFIDDVVLNASLFEIGLTDSITAFANADPSSVAVTSVTDNSGVAVFTTTAVHNLEFEDVVVHTGFSEGTYNGTFIVSKITSTTEYEVTLNDVGVAFVATGTGTLQNKRVLVTSAAHGLTIADTPVLITETTNYDAGYNIKNILTNSYEIQAAFVADDAAGTWDSGSLDETEPRVIVTNSPPTPTSRITGEFDFVNIVTPQLVTIVTQDVPVAINGGNWTSSVLERVKTDIVGDGIATLTAQGTDKYVIGFSALMEKLTGGSTNIALTILINGVDVVNNPPRSVNSGIIQISGSKILSLSEGDTIQLAVFNTDDTNNIEVSQASMSIAVAV